MPFFGWGGKGTTATGKGPVGRSLELIQYDTGSGKFTVGQEALQVLQAVKGPVRPSGAELLLCSCAGPACFLS